MERRQHGARTTFPLLPGYGSSNSPSLTREKGNKYLFETLSSLSHFPDVPVTVVRAQDLNATDSAESLALQDPGGDVLDTSAGKEQELLCSVYLAKPEVLIPQSSISQDYLGPATAGYSYTIGRRCRPESWLGCLVSVELSSPLRCPCR